MSQSNDLPNTGLPPLTRFITTHNAEGKAVFSDTIDEATKMTLLPKGGAVFALSYCTESFPVDMNEEKDIKSYQKYLEEPPGLVVSGGTVLRHVDCPPGSLSPMHRTVSLDYGIVLEGEVACVLDSGEERILKRGDICIQRGTNHAWRNTSETEWARMLYVLQPSQPLKLGAKELGEELGTMADVRAST